MDNFSKRYRYLLFALSFLFAVPVFGARADTSSVEWIKVYFNMPADTTVAKEGNRVHDNANLMETLIDLIDSAEYSVDLATYYLSNHRVGEALVRAAERGVRVRVVTDHYNRYSNREHGERIWGMLADAEIYSIDDAGEIHKPDGTVDSSQRLVGASYDMHHKFAVIDILSDDPDDYFVWTGAMNLTYTGPVNTNNTIVIKDSGIAKAYHNEFNQMWGGSGDTPNARRARFHKDKRFVGETTFYVDTTKVELYFGPINRDRSKPSIAARLNELVDKAEHDVNFLAFAITPDWPLSQNMWRRSFADNILLQGLIDPRFYAQYRNAGAIWATPEAQAGNRNIRQARELRILHQKIMLFDVTKPFENDNGIAVAGSYNFSRNAEENNDENLLIFHCRYIANQYYQDFMGAMNRATGKSEAPVPPVDPDEWYKVRDVPDGSRIEFEVAYRFGYPVRPLGVEVPRVFAGRDTSDFYAAETAEFVANLLQGKKIRLTGPDGGVPRADRGAYIAYIEAKAEDGTIIHLNRKLIEEGYGQWMRFYSQHPDSVAAFQELTTTAREAGVGYWQYEDRIGERIPRVQVGRDADEAAVSFPININTADERTLQALSGVGPAISARIVEHRQEHGLFSDIDELENVRGIGPATMQRLRPYITVD